MTKRLALFAALAFLASAPDARADSIPMTPGTAGKNLALSADGSANSYPNHVFCGGATATIFATVTNCAIVNASGQVLTLDTQSGSWTVTANAGTNLNTSLLATSANQTNATAKTQIVDGAGSVIASTSNNLNVQCANCSGSGVSTADQASFTAGASLFAGSGGFFQTTATNNALTNGQQGLFQATANRAIFANLRNAAGTEIATASTPLQVSLANTAANAAAILTTGTGGTFPITAAALPLPTGAATSALQPTNAAQGSTTSAQTGLLMEGAVTTASPSYTTGQTSPFSLDLNGALRVNITAGAGSGGTALADNAAWTVGTTNMTPMGCEFTTAGATAITTAHAGTVACTAARGLFTDQTSVSGTALSNGTEAYGTAFASQTATVERVDAFVTNTNSNVANNADAVAAGASAGSPVVGYLLGFNGTTWDRLQVDASKFLKINCATGCAGGTFNNNADAVATSSTNGQTAAWLYGYNGTTFDRLQVDASKFLKVTIAAASATNISINEAQVNGVTTSTGSGAVGTGSQRMAVGIDSATIAGSVPGTAGTASTNVVTVQGIASMTPFLVNPGTVANWALGPTNATIPGNAQLAGYVAATANPTAASNNNLIGAMVTPNGKQIVQPWALTPDLVDGGGSSTTTAAITLIAASGSAAIKEYLTSLQCSRSDAGTTAITVAVSEGTKTRTFVIPNNGGGGGNNIPLVTPIVFAANTAVTATPSAGVTTLYCNAEGFYAP